MILGVQVAVPGARLLLLPTRTLGRARSHGGAGHYSTARDRRVLPLFGGLLRKSRYGNHSKRVKKMFQIALHSKYWIYNARLWKDAVLFYVSIIFLLWLETWIWYFVEATFHSSKELIENTIQDETHCHLVYGFEFLLSAKSFLSLLNQRKIKMTVIFVVPNTQCFSMTRDDIWWVGMSTKAHKLKLIQTFGCGTSEYLLSHIFSIGLQTKVHPKVRNHREGPY